MITVKVVIKGSNSRPERVLRQIPGDKGEWGQCRFIMDPDLRDYDWLLVYDDLPAQGTERYSTRAEKLSCPRENTIFVMAEPPAIKTYGYHFLNQFGTVISCHGPAASPRAKTIRTIPGLLWFHGADSALTYDQMQANPPLNKQADLSTVYSAKSMKHTLHEKRRRLTLALHERLPEMDVFGAGFRKKADKHEALDPYRYHFAMENTIVPYYITEKITDAYLGLCLPFYVGAPNVSDYFPPESYIVLDPDKPDEAAAIIRAAIANNEYEQRLPALIEARRLVMDEYNLFAIARRLIEAKTAMSSIPAKPQKPALIYSRRGLIRHNLWYALCFLVEKLKARLMNRLTIWLKYK